jgi:hypothetical protein
MQAPTLRPTSRPNFNILMVGSRFEASTTDTTYEGEYLGLETPYGERSILIRDQDGKTSTIPVRRVVSLTAA